MRRRQVLGVFVAACAEPRLARAAAVRVYGDDSYPPVAYLRHGRPSGLMAALLERVQSATGDRYDLQLMPWRRAYELAARGEAGLIGTSFNSDRAAIFDFSKPVYDDDIQIVVLKERGFAYRRVEDLRGKIVGGVSGASYGEEIDRAIREGVFIVDRDVSATGRLRKLLAMRLDAAFVGNGALGLQMLLNSHEDLNKHRERFIALPTPASRDPLHFVFHKSMRMEPLIARFNDAFDRLKASGEFAQMIARLGRVE